MATNVNHDEEERGLQEENLASLRNLRLSELSEEDEERARVELEKYDDFERQVEILDGTDRQTVEEYQCDIDNINEQIERNDAALDEIQKSLDQAEAQKMSHLEELKQLNNDLLSMTMKIETVQQELQALRKEQFDLIVKQNEAQLLSNEQNRILNDEKVKMKAIEEQITVLNNQRILFEEQHKKLTQILSDNQSGLLSLEQQIESLKIELGILTTGEEALQSELTQAKAHLEQLNKKLETVQQHLAKCTEDLQQNTNLLQQLQQEQKQTDMEIQVLRDSIQKIEQAMQQVCRLLSLSKAIEILFFLFRTRKNMRI